MVAALNENSQLEAKVQQLENELQNQVGEREGVGEGGVGRGGKERRWRKIGMHTLPFLQLKAHKRGIEESEVTINLLLKRQSEDKVHTQPPQPRRPEDEAGVQACELTTIPPSLLLQEAISSFMFQVQELRSANTMANAKISSLKQEIEDSESELGSATARIDLLTSQVDAHHVELGKLSKQHERELKKKESEVSGKRV